MSAGIEVRQGYLEPCAHPGGALTAAHAVTAKTDLTNGGGGREMDGAPSVRRFVAGAPENNSLQTLINRTVC
jgi:hypothetical protein